jgi:2'-hydroxyisoflavone reductase
MLGGTVFLGRHCAEVALERGHAVTLFHRGTHGADLFPLADRILGNRDGGLDALRGRSWDAVIDTSGYVPRVVSQSVAALRESVGLYAFVSSVSVYADFSRIGLDEDAPLGHVADPSIEEITGETYGALKALCEDEVTRTFGSRSLIVRPGLIVGPHDPTDRFTYWPVRLQRGGVVLAPGSGDAAVQFIDVRDLAHWMVEMCEDGAGGIYNAVGPSPPVSFGGLLEECRAVARSNARVEWVPERFLLDRGVAPWTEVPLWVPDEPDSAGFDSVSGERAYAAGLTCRPVADTIRDTLDWHASLPEDRIWRAGLAAEREAELLREWDRLQSERAAA